MSFLSLSDLVYGWFGYLNKSILHREGQNEEGDLYMWVYSSKRTYVCGVWILESPLLTDITSKTQRLFKREISTVSFYNNHLFLKF